ncbi:methyltransferase domain-containing protein [Rhizohabitans arisaemae]|uniref:methyltransferase domain-containing protein n=1 Tax=Rhizohabitans arisaemae TaxID=2720610 RepID=UPI0024B163F7|nr:methyltransferase domain-containing protein [Rhizohabitans arisaemae]
MTAARLVARCIRGLEPIAATEILRAELGTVTGLGHREVRFQAAPPARWIEPRTADDVFLLAGRIPDIGRVRAGLGGLAELTAALDLDSLLARRRAYGGRGRLTGVEVSASFLGRRNFNRYDAEDVIGSALARRLGVPYRSRRDGTPPPDLDGGWRLTLDGEHATLMLRIGLRPAHRRDYKRATIPGTLHPPVAAAMAILADVLPGQRVLDPCCGAGTLLIEAERAQPLGRFQGYDLDPAALRAARVNAAGSTAVRVGAADAGDLPLADGSVDRVVANPPWGAQVRAGGRLAGAPERWWAEIRRVLTPTGSAVVLIPDTGDLAAAIRYGLVPTYVQQVSLFGSRPSVVRLVPREPSGGSDDRIRRDH